MENFISHILELVAREGSLGVFLASFIEEIIVPIPSTLVQSGAGLLFLSDMGFSFHGVWVLISKVVLPSAFGVTIGSLFLYALAYWGGMVAVKNFGKYFFITEAKVLRAKETILEKKGLLFAFCVLRFIPLFPNSLVTVGAGILRLPLWPYIWTTFLGTFVRVSFLGSLGWAAGIASKNSKSPAIFSILILIFLLILISVITLVILSLRKKK